MNNSKVQGALVRNLCMGIIGLSIVCATQVMSNQNYNWSLGRTLCRWSTDDIFYISPFGKYAFMRYDISRSSDDTLLNLDPRRAVIAFTQYQDDKRLFLISHHIPVSEFWFGILPNMKTGTSQPVRNVLTARNTSIVSLYDTQTKICVYDTSLHGDSWACFISPDEGRIIVNTIFWVAILGTSDLQARSDSSAVYAFDIHTKEWRSLSSYVGSNAIALGYTPDSQLLFLEINQEPEKTRLLTFNEQDMILREYPSAINWRAIDYRTIRTLPKSSIITWFNSKERKIYFYNLATGQKQSIRSESNSFCFSSDGKEAAFFAFDDWQKKMHVRIKKTTL